MGISRCDVDATFGVMEKTNFDLGPKMKNSALSRLVMVPRSWSVTNRKSFDEVDLSIVNGKSQEQYILKSKSCSDTTRKVRKISLQKFNTVRNADNISKKNGFRLAASLENLIQDNIVSFDSFNIQRKKPNLNMDRRKSSSFNSIDYLDRKRVSKTRKLSQQPVVRRKMGSVSEPPCVNTETDTPSVPDTPATKRKKWLTNIMSKTLTINEVKKKRNSVIKLSSLAGEPVPFIVDVLLQFIADNDCAKLKEFLRKSQSNISAGKKILFHQAAYTGCTNCCFTLLKHGFRPDVTDIEGWTPLHAAVLAGNANVVGYLLPLYSDINIVDSSGLSPLHIAVYTNNLYLTNILVKFSAKVYLESEFVTPFQLAIDLKHNDLLDCFILKSTLLVN